MALMNRRLMTRSIRLSRPSTSPQPTVVRDRASRRADRGSCRPAWRSDWVAPARARPMAREALDRQARKASSGGQVPAKWATAGGCVRRAPAGRLLRVARRLLDAFRCLGFADLSREAGRQMPTPVTVLSPSIPLLNGSTRLGAGSPGEDEASNHAGRFGRHRGPGGAGVTGASPSGGRSSCPAAAPTGEMGATAAACSSR
jgi:hypothetical protein